MSKLIQFRVECLRSDFPVRGNAMASGDDAYDRQVEDQIRADLEWNEWAWCTVKVTAFIPGIDLEGTDYLGGCSYRDEADFRAGDYFEDMCAVARVELLKQVAAVKALAE